jgi:hypothetical protein
MTFLHSPVTIPGSEVDEEKAEKLNLKPFKVNIVQGRQDLSYVSLKPAYLKRICWSTDPRDLASQTYFNLTRPNLSRDFNVEGLQPILRELGNVPVPSQSFTGSVLSLERVA